MKKRLARVLTSSVFVCLKAHVKKIALDWAVCKRAERQWADCGALSETRWPLNFP
jgi:hypothetical protein